MRPTVDPARTEAIVPLEDRLGHPFADRELLRLALTHRSWCAEHAGFESNERLEFLGDAVLGMVVTDHVFANYESMPEGGLAKLRASVVSAPTLGEVAGRLELGSVLRLGKGEDASGGRQKLSILADALEAVFGAVHLDAGLDVARSVILELLRAHITEAAAGPGLRDYKTQLQELAARAFEQLPVYEVRHEGPDHARRFFARVLLGGTVRGTGEGTTKKLAEQAAAHDAWLALAATGAAEEPAAAEGSEASDDDGSSRASGARPADTDVRERADA